MPIFIQYIAYYRKGSAVVKALASHQCGQDSNLDRRQPHSQGSLLPALRSVGRVGETPGNQVGSASTPYVGSVCCLFSPLLQEVSLRVLWFSPFLKN